MTLASSLGNMNTQLNSVINFYYIFAVVALTGADRKIGLHAMKADTYKLQRKVRVDVKELQEKSAWCGTRNYKVWIETDSLYHDTGTEGLHCDKY